MQVEAKAKEVAQAAHAKLELVREKTAGVLKAHHLPSFFGGPKKEKQAAAAAAVAAAAAAGEANTAGLE
jgi:hypothetical protein